MKFMLRMGRGHWPDPVMPDGAGYSPESAVSIPKIHRSATALYILREALHDGRSKDAVRVSFSPAAVVALPKDHPLLGVLHDVANPARPLPDAVQIKQQAWGGVPAYWLLLVAVLRRSVERILCDLQSMDNVLSGSLQPWSLVRTFGMWLSTTLTLDGKEQGKASAEVGQIGKILCGRLGAVTAVRHVRQCWLRVLGARIGRAEAEGDVALEAWQSCQELCHAVLESLCLAIISGRLDVSA